MCLLVCVCLGVCDLGCVAGRFHAMCVHEERQLCITDAELAARWAALCCCVCVCVGSWAGGQGCMHGSACVCVCMRGCAAAHRGCSRCCRLLSQHSNMCQKAVCVCVVCASPGRTYAKWLLHQVQPAAAAPLPQHLIRCTVGSCAWLLQSCQVQRFEAA